MGWTETTMGAREHIDDTIGAENIVRRAWGAGSYGEKHCWLHVKTDTFEGIVLVLVKYGKMYGRTSTCIKVVDETMGPGVYDVPDKIWDNRPPTPADSEWATEWRTDVEEFRARWPRKATDLGEADIGTRFKVAGYTDPMTFTGWKRHRRGEVPTFGHCRIASWRTARVAPATEAVAA